MELGIILSILGIILTFLLPIINKHNKFDKLINEFKSQIKLPKILGNEQKLPKIIDKNHLFYNEHFTGIDVTNLNINNNIIEEFVNNINKFSPIFYKQYYNKYKKNINTYKISDKIEKGFLLYFILNYKQPTNFLSICIYNLHIKGRFQKYKRKIKLFMYNKTKNTK
jgi:hypothetical protein